MLLIGWKVFAWGSVLTPQPVHCNTCGVETPFLQKTAMRFITLFFLPVIPISSRMHLIECPKCKTRYETK